MCGRLHRRLAAALTVTAIAASGPPPAGAQEAPGALSPQQLESGETYTLSLPAGGPGEAPAPLVVSLHYGGPVTPYYGAALLEQVVEPALRGLGAVMVAPDCARPTWLDCEAGLLRVLDHVLEALALDRGRVLLTGYSKGGIGTWELSLRHPERFTAAIPMAGRPRPEMADAPWSVPLHAINSTADELFPAQAAIDVVAALQARGVDASIDVLDDVTHYETPRYLEPLRAAVPWIRDRWQR